MTSEAETLRRALAKGERGRGRRYEPALKQRAVAYIRRRRRAGAGYRDIGVELGLGTDTVRRWCIDDARRPGAPRSSRPTRFAPVEVVPEPRSSTVTLVSPSGYRVEGLSLDDALTALRALR